MSDGLMLIHAFPLDARMWRPQQDAFGEGLAIVAPDLPGFGGAPSAGPVMSMGAAAATCLQAADAAGFDRMVVCGLSMGGYVAFELWRMARQRIAGLILANTRSGEDAPEGAAGRRALAARLRAEGNGFLVAEPPPLLGADAPAQLWEQVRASIADQPAEAIAAAAVGMAERRDSTPDLSTIDVPCLVITAEGDTLIPPDVTAAMTEHIPDATLVRIGGAGHLSNMEAPDAFDDAVRAFLPRCD
jgi:pimeloyl-ACP methyl ester carboxylesterase